MAMEKPIRLLIADDHQLFRSGINSLLNGFSDIVIIGEAQNGAQLVEKYFELIPDVILVDISMPEMNGIEALKMIKRRDKNVKAIFLTMFEGEEYIYSSMKVGAKGLLSKNTAKGELIYAIKSIYSDQKYFGKQYDDEKLKLIEKTFKGTTAANLDEFVYLTNKERQILEYISKGLTSHEIADKFNRSKKTIDHYRHKMMQRLKIKSLPEFISFAVKYSRANKLIGDE
jgi:DNA-binding NarL/FixJ family response regulator